MFSQVSFKRTTLDFDRKSLRKNSLFTACRVHVAGAIQDTACLVCLETEQAGKRSASNSVRFLDNFKSLGGLNVPSRASCCPQCAAAVAGDRMSVVSWRCRDAPRSL